MFSSLKQNMQINSFLKWKRFWLHEVITIKKKHYNEAYVI